MPTPILAEVGDLNTTHHRVAPGDLADTHHDSAPPVLATSRLMQWCEHTAREALPGAATVAAVQINHRSPVVLGMLAAVRVECTEFTQWTTMWKVTVAAGESLVADGTITLNAIDLQDYVARIVNPLVRHHKLVPTSEDQGP